MRDVLELGQGSHSSLPGYYGCNSSTQLSLKTVFLKPIFLSFKWVQTFQILFIQFTFAESDI